MFQITCFDVKLTHEGSQCPATRYVPDLKGGLVCLDCGRQVMLAAFKVPSPKDPPDEDR